MKEYTKKELLELIDAGKFEEEHAYSMISHEIAAREKRNPDGSPIAMSLCEVYDRYFVLQLSIIRKDDTKDEYIYKSITEVAAPNTSATDIIIKFWDTKAIKDGELFEFSQVIDPKELWTRLG